MRELTLHEAISISGGAPATPVVAAPAPIKKGTYLSDYLHELTPWVVGVGAAFIGHQTASTFAQSKGYNLAKQPFAGVAALASFLGGHFLGQGVNVLTS